MHEVLNSVPTVHKTGCCDIHLYTREIRGLKVIPSDKVISKQSGYRKPASEDWLKIQMKTMSLGLGTQKQQSFQSLSKGIQ